MRATAFFPIFAVKRAVAILASFAVVAIVFAASPAANSSGSYQQYIPTIRAESGTPYAGAPLCPTHNDRMWHSLWDSVRGCHYDHEHKDNPHEVDDIFGTDYYDWAGGEISYPWQTFVGAGEGYPQPGAPGTMENDLKHGGYGWMVRRDIPCSEEPCITDFRFQYHGIMAAHGGVTRFHSYWIEVRVRHSGGQHSFVRRGGWIDFGIMNVDFIHVPLPDDRYLGGNVRSHHSWNMHGGGAPAVWYGGNFNPYASFAIVTADSWGPVDPADPFNNIIFCPNYDCERNGSTMEPHRVFVRTEYYHPEPYQAAQFDGSPIDTDPRTNWVATSGYTDRYGSPATTCTSVGLDCVPVLVETLPAWQHIQYHGDGVREYDLSPEGVYWIRFPN